VSAAPRESAPGGKRRRRCMVLAYVTAMGQRIGSETYTRHGKDARAARLERLSIAQA